MKKVWALCWLELKQILIKPQSYILMFGMPIIFTLIFGGLLGGSGNEKVNISLIDQDGSTLSNSYYKEIKKSDLISIEKVTDEEAKQKIENKKSSGIVTIPKNFQKSMVDGKIEKVKFQSSADFTGGASVEQILQSTMKKMEIEVAAARDSEKNGGMAWEKMYEMIHTKVEPVSLQKESIVLGEKKLNNVTGRAAGFSILFVMIVMLSATGTILKARQLGVWYRLLGTPVSKAQILGGYILSFFLIGWIQFGTLMVLTNVLFDVQWGNLLGIIILVSVLLLAVIGLALFLASIVKTTDQQSALGNIVVISTCMISGLYWPIEIEPEWMQTVANFIPQTWAMRGFTELIARGGTLADIAGYIGILMLFAGVFFIIGLTRIRYD
ncbi:ABC transporter permease [Bacillus pseudomycoides]|uniref:ABC transporter ATP-binding protein n=1 Tax=Bacillus pseudomycoides TaxID=64104 RepID=A0A2C3XAM0_9BACI|nr:ABC transporter permease [Bacillus pseudomycoides]PDY46050.1 ABC transporter ATP-binding protein [Bacillus pseudomycoides]PED71393.1 ABC transporter ATP-binding protein [Bacillus pseudomycoides]PEI41989.1 ABC transporter ATP-binding protein [Bacillus pseudomycoides]PEJ75264.1 ABC transporter ATP-binding protein [Bacillus pseudomycoides]PEM18909.1 ABC transporter ATP-binding protein [Bacillus pseudomycoides]